MTSARDELPIADKVLALHEAFTAARLPYAFGGALALAWCTRRARGTIDIDVNVFVGAARSRAVFAALPGEVRWEDADVIRCERDGQVRIWWGTTPVDLFTNTTDFHAGAADRCIVHEFAGARVPFLACADLAVFKAFFNRPRDWADLDEMRAAGTLGGDHVLGVLVRYLGGDDERVGRLRALLVPD